MKIKVLYPEGIGYVDPAELDTLIASGKIMAFFRQNKMVVVGVHKTRQKKLEWQEPERRSSAG